MSVASPEDAMRQVERIVDRANGFVEESTTDEDSEVRMYVHVPSGQLDAIMDTIAALGRERGRSINATDVTDQYADLETRLRNSRSLRDRLRQLLDRATEVEDILAIEKELNRVQAEVETMEARFERLRSDIELSALSIRLHRKRILGPLGYAAYGLWWSFSKLFVIR